MNSKRAAKARESDNFVRRGAACLVLALSMTILPLYAAGSISEADSLLLSNKYRDAEDAYRSLLESDTTGDAYAGLAVALAKQAWPAKVLEAEKILKQAKNKYEENPNVIAAAGYVSYVHSKNVASPAKRDLYLEASQTLCERAIKSNPDILIAQQTLGLADMAQDQLSDALVPLKRAVELAENPVNLTLLAQCLLKLDAKDKEARNDIDQALSLNSSYEPAHLQKAVILNADGKAEDAFMQLHDIPAQYRTYDWYQVEGDIYRKQGDGPAALASWREAIRLEPHNPEAYRHMAEYYTVRGDGEMAISQLHDALEILPNDMALRTQLAELALRQDKLDIAETEYRTILSANPDDSTALLGLSRVYFRKARRDGQYPPGWQQLMDQLQNVMSEESVQGKVLKVGAKDLQENIKLSEAEKDLASNHFKDARQLLGTIISTHKDDPYELMTLGDQAFSDGDLRSAEQAYTSAKEIPEVAPRAEQGLSKIVSQRNEADRQTKLGGATTTLPEVALDHYKQALIADPQSADAYYGLYTLYAKSRKPDLEKAINYATLFLEAASDDNEQKDEVQGNLEKMKQRLSRTKRSK
jgi:tetratricopeptide (TPR) repeat protein